MNYEKIVEVILLIPIILSFCALIIAARAYSWARKTALFAERYKVYYELKIFLNDYKDNEPIDLITNKVDVYKLEVKKLHAYTDKLKELLWKSDYIFKSQNIGNMLSELIHLLSKYLKFSGSENSNNEYIEFTALIRYWVTNKLERANEKTRLIDTKYGNFYLDDMFENELNIYRSIAWLKIKRFASTLRLKINR